MGQSIDMTQIVGKSSILWICLDSLRYDVAMEEEQAGGTPYLNQYGTWQKRQAPGNFTYPSHQAMFAGFFPVESDVTEMKQREKLFFAEDVERGRKTPEGAFHFQGSNWVQGLEQEGYKTYCIGGLSFFDGRSQLGKVMPGYFQKHYWTPAFGCKVKDSARHQVDTALRLLKKQDENEKIFLYINVSALHYPCYMYLEGAKKDSVEAQRAALRYVDGELGRLFAGFQQFGDTFVICCSDHGTCFGEDGMWYHGFSHPLVNTVPYKHFLLQASCP